MGRVITGRGKVTFEWWDTCKGREICLGHCMAFCASSGIQCVCGGGEENGE